MISKNGECAKAYARLNIFVLDIHSIRDGICSCGKPQCTSPGKHPIHPNGLLSATTDLADIEERWTRVPDANIGIACEQSGILVFDCDIYHNDLEKLAALELNLGPLPVTVTQRSGSGEGYHPVYRKPGFPVRGVIGGVVVRSRAYIVASPSNHLSGGNYVWQEGLGLGEIEIAELPDAWKEALKKTATVGQVGAPAEEPEWLAAIPQEQRIADMRAHFAREPGEVKGTSLAGTTFNIVRSAIRSHAVRDPEIALEVAMEIYDPKCTPPWGARMARHVHNSYQRAHSPEWGAAYRGEEQRLEALGLDKVPVVPAPAPRGAPRDIEVMAALQSVQKKRVSDAARILDKELVTRVVTKTYLGDDELLTAQTLVRVCPPGTTDDQIVALLQGCMLPEERARELVQEARPRPPSAVPGGISMASLVDSLPAYTLGGAPIPTPFSTIPDEDQGLLSELKMDAEGEGVKNTPNNLFEILSRDSIMQGKIRFDALTKQVVISAPTFADSSNTLATGVMNWMDKKWQVSANRGQIEDQLLLIARRNEFNPIADYLTSVVWDRKSRIDTWLIDYCGAEDNEFNRRIGAMWLISAVARGIVPGSKVDTVLILEGGQGEKKSTALSVLAGEWFSDSPLVIGNKDSMQMASYRWIIELAELASLRASESESQKAFISARVDNYRPPYGKAPEEFKRFAVFGGSTNEDEYLPDYTGNRRYWPVRVVKCDVIRLRADRDQLWAEATLRYKSAELNLHLAHPECPGERWWFETEEEQDMAAAVVDKRRPENPWTGLIREWVKRNSLGPNTRRQWTLAEISKSALDIEIEKLPSKQRGITVAIKEAGLIPAFGDEGQAMWRMPDSAAVPESKETEKRALHDAN